MYLSLPSDHHCDAEEPQGQSLWLTWGTSTFGSACHSFLKSQTADRRRGQRQTNVLAHEQPKTLTRPHTRRLAACPPTSHAYTKDVFSNQRSRKSFTSFWRTFKSQVCRSPSMQRVMRGVGNVYLTGHREHAVTDGGIVRSRQKKRELRGECAFVRVSDGVILQPSLTGCPRRPFAVKLTDGLVALNICHDTDCCSKSAPKI